MVNTRIDCDASPRETSRFRDGDPKPKYKVTIKMFLRPIHHIERPGDILESINFPKKCWDYFLLEERIKVMTNTMSNQELIQAPGNARTKSKCSTDNAFYANLHA